jgi:acyl dehydratase
VIASGWHTVAVVMRVVVDRYLSPVAGLPSPGVDELRWLRPVRPGERLSVTATVVDRRIFRSKPDRGLVHSRMVASDHSGAEAMTVRAISFVLLDPVPRGA